MQAVARDLADERATHAESLRRLAAVRSQAQTLEHDLNNQTAMTVAKGDEGTTAVLALEAENTRLRSEATVREKTMIAEVTEERARRLEAETGLRSERAGRNADRRSARARCSSLSISQTPP
jgi:hypothetical protein